MLHCMTNLYAFRQLWIKKGGEVELTDEMIKICRIYLSTIFGRDHFKYNYLNRCNSSMPAANMEIYINSIN